MPDSSLPWSISLVDPSLLVAVDLVAALALGVLLWRSRRPGRRWWLRVAAGAAIGAGLGYALVWIIGDVANAFDVPPSVPQRVSITVVAAVLGAILVAAATGRRPASRDLASREPASQDPASREPASRRARPGARPAARFAARVVLASAGTLVLALVAGALAINNDIGLYRTLGQVVGQDGLHPLALPEVVGDAVAFDPHLDDHFREADDQPESGRVGSVVIPGTRSGFASREAYVYLPPAALAADPPKLPVVILLSGQPGDPSKMILAGRVTETADALARSSHGLAPIIVVPDQLGRSDANPMCVDGPLGNSATYLTSDVPAWITTHLNVETDRRAWAIGGFSQGGTCALQFGAGYPDLFGSFIDVAGQKGPRLSGGRSTVQAGFGGDQAAYDRAQPSALLRAHAPYADTVGVFVAGEDDTRYGPVMRDISARAERAGIRVERFVPESSGHDWKTVSAGIQRALEVLWPRLGLGSTGGDR